MRTRPLRRLSTALPLLALLLPLAGQAEPNPSTIPAPGSVVPAFALYPYNEEAVSKEAGEDRAWVELDQYCGIRGGEDSPGVLLAFLDESTGAADLEVAAAWERKFSKRGLHILVVSESTSPAEFANTVKRARYRFPVLDDRHGVVATRYGLSEVPFTFILDSDCRVIGFNNRSLSQDTARIEGALEQLADEHREAKKRDVSRR